MTAFTRSGLTWKSRVASSTWASKIRDVARARWKPREWMSVPLPG